MVRLGPGIGGGGTAGRDGSKDVGGGRVQSGPEDI